MGEDECQRKIAERCSRVAQLPEEERQAELHRMIVAEYELDGARLQNFTRCRLLGWLAMSPEDANTIARGYDVVFNNLSGETAMRRTTVVQAVVRDFAPEQIEALHGLIPTTTAAIPAMRQPEIVAFADSRARPGEEAETFLAFLGKLESAVCPARPLAGQIRPVVATTESTRWRGQLPRITAETDKVFTMSSSCGGFAVRPRRLQPRRLLL